MINNLELSGFKTFSTETVIGLRELVILAGTNSAGKSTIIQALTALKQSIEEAPPTGSLELNGPYVRLGGFKDAVSRRAEPPLFRIGLTACDDGPQTSISYQFTEHSGRPIISELIYSDGGQTHSFGSFDLPEHVRVVLRRLNLQHALATRTGQNIWVAMVGPIPKWEISFEPTPANISLQNHLRALADEKIIEIIDFLLERTPGSGARTRAIIEAIETQRDSPSAPEMVTSLDSLLEAMGLPAARELTRELLTNEEEAILRANLRPDQVQIFERLLSFSETELDVASACEALIQDSNALPLTGYSIRSDGLSGRISHFISETFKNIFYLGPLRRPPSLSYSDNLDLSTRILPDGTGLMTHLQLKWNENTDFRLADGSLQQGTVGECINSWCRHLGICDGLEIHGGADREYELKFIPLGQNAPENHIHPLDLPTNVGVGVTQLLPVIALLVIAGPDTTCLFEQPELHLHPSAQTKLAELFVSSIQSGRQLIIETHSEHLINGIRFSVAAKTISPDKIQMVFVSSESTGAKIREVEMDNRGLIDSWPPGFFDEAEKGAIRLLGATLKSRKGT